MENIFDNYTTKRQDPTSDDLGLSFTPKKTTTPTQTTYKNLSKIGQQKSALLSGILEEGMRRNAQPQQIAQALFKANKQTGFFSMNEINQAVQQYTAFSEMGKPTGGSISVSGKNFSTGDLNLSSAIALDKYKAEKQDEIKKQASVVDSLQRSLDTLKIVKDKVKKDEGFTAVVGLRNPILTKTIEQPDGTERVVGRAGTQASGFTQAFGQLIDQLTLKARQAIKGQGTITDKETDMLARAQTLANATLSEKDFKKELDRLERDITESIKEREAMTGVNDLNLSQIEQLPDDQAKALFDRTLQQARQNPTDPRSKKFLYAVELGKINPATGKPNRSAVEGLGTITNEEYPKKKDIGGIDSGTAWLKKGDSFVFGDNGLLQNVGEALGKFGGRLPSIIGRTAEDIANGAKAYKALFDYTVDNNQGALDNFIKEHPLKNDDYNTPLDFAGATGKLLSDLVSAGFELADDATGEIVSKTIGNLVEGAIATEGGRKALEAWRGGKEKWERYAEENPGTAKDIASLVEVGEGVLAYYTAKSAVEGSKAIFGKLKEKLPAIKETGSNLKNKISFNKTQTLKTKESLPSRIGGAVDETTDKIKSSTGELIDKYHEGVIDRRFTRAGASKQKLAKVIEKTGFDNKQAKLIATMKPKDKAVAKRMIKLADKIDDGSGRITARPIDYVGENMVKKQAKIDLLRRAKGAKLNKVAKSLKGKKFDSTPITNEVAKAMDDLGITLTKEGAYDFSESVFKDLPSLQKRLAQAFGNARRIGDDPYQAHIFKKSIDELVNYGTSGEGLKGSSEVALKNLRRVADDTIDSQFLRYAKINNEYRDLAEVSRMNKELFGKSGATAIKAGQKMRSVFSNASVSRDKALTYLDRLENVAKKYNIQTGDNVLDQALFAQALEKPYGAFTDTALVNEVGKGIQEGLNTAGSLRSPLRFVGNVASKTYQTITSKTPEVQKQLLRKLFGVTKKTSSIKKGAPLKEVLKYFKENNGATFDVKKGKLLTGKNKYIVSPYPERTVTESGKTITAGQMAKYIKENKELLKKPYHDFGLWYDTDSKKTFFDVAINTSNKQKAIELGKKFDQIEIWDLANNKGIKIGGSGGLTK